MSDEKSPDLLPAGWNVDLKRRKSGKKDKYYTDPATGYVFRSLKDVHRYLETGHVGKLALKPKVNSHVDMELEDDNLPTQAEADEHKLPDRGTNGERKSSKLVETVNDEQILESTSTADCTCVSDNASDPCRENAAVSDINLPEANESKDIEEKSKPIRYVSVPATVIGTPEKKPLKNRLEELGNIQLERNKSSEKSKLGLPRRASKRLAGIKVNLPPEPKTRRQATARRAVEAETRTATSEERDVKGETDNTLSEKHVNPIVLPKASLSTPEEHGRGVETDNKLKERQKLLSTPEDHGGNTEMENKRGEKQELPTVLPPTSLSTSEEHGRKFEKYNKPNEKQEPSITLPPVNLSTPKEHGGEVEIDNISNKRQDLPSEKEEHGVQVEIDNNPSDKKERPIVLLQASLSTENKSCEKQELPIVFPPVRRLFLEERAGGVKTESKADVKPESPVNLSLMDLWTDPCIEFAVKTLTGAIPIGDENKTDDYPGSPLDLPLGGLWTDPCIEFAVKTLTGAIPVGEDLSVQDYFQQQNQGENGFSLPDVGLNNLCQTDLLSQHCDNAENSPHKQQESVPNNRNVSLKNSGQSGIRQNVEGGSGECSRQTFF